MTPTRPPSASGSAQVRPSSKPRGVDPDLAAGIGLAFVAGFVDAAAFIALAGLFTAHVTGNFVLLGAELVSTSVGVVAKLLALPAFVIAVAVTRLLALALERRGAAPLRWLLALEIVLLAGFAVMGLALSPLGSPDGAAAVTVGMMGVAAMGVQNAIGRLGLAHLAATTVMTVNITQAVIDLVDWARGAVPPDGPARGRLRRMVPAVLAFAIGALAGAFGVAAWSFGCLAIPIAALIGLMLLRLD
ncbi:YoaK family protein [Methylobacterium sp. Leaf117]|uniref:YoaK family protein n=1 Tax=Methylobacterium sp. Leaf117 TaxID=1736260 RepID=UPI0006F72C26|nr:YoaK family protein [Methylobacterium sp. Leaf117]KQP95509.1 permease [Methylobacterium sp. Leaf117]